MSGATWGLLTAVFAASLVEFVEALTIVLAMGMTRSWKSALTGTAVAVVALVGFTLVAGYALVNWLPESALRAPAPERPQAAARSARATAAIGA